MSALLVLYMTVLAVLFIVAALFLYQEVMRIEDIVSRLENALENAKDRDDKDDFDLFS